MEETAAPVVAPGEEIAVVEDVVAGVEDAVVAAVAAVAAVAVAVREVADAADRYTAIDA
jgi:hypothetical protein